jgi:hypothetical protein
MKSRITVKCSCGKQWSDSEDAATASFWWQALEIVHPGMIAATDKKGDGKTTELALRIIWAKHSMVRKEKGDKRHHEATVTQEIIIDDIGDLEKIKRRLNAKEV